jgi:hypothetical protein
MDYPDPKYTFSRGELVDAYAKWNAEQEANPDDFQTVNDDPGASADYLLRLLRDE